MYDDLRVGPRLTIPAAELSWRFSRSSGAGGQHVNTTDSRVELSFDIERSTVLTETHRSRIRRALPTRLVDGVITIVAADRRSQTRNRADARDRLAELLVDAIAPPPPAAPPDPSHPRLPAASSRRQEAPRRNQASPPTPHRLNPGFSSESRWLVRPLHGSAS